jgi:hypothetical protein
MTVSSLSASRSHVPSHAGSHAAQLVMHANSATVLPPSLIQHDTVVLGRHGRQADVPGPVLETTAAKGFHFVVDPPMCRSAWLWQRWRRAQREAVRGPHGHVADVRRKVPLPASYPLTVEPGHETILALKTLTSQLT